jgi:rubrerythrin
MKDVIVTYETFHGSAKKVAEVISNKLNCKCINVDTPFEAENLSELNTVVLVFNFRGPYTAQLTKLYLSRVKDQLKSKNVILVGEGLFSEKEFPVVAEEIYKSNPSKTFNKFFVNGQLRVDTLFPEEKALLAKFSEITGMEIKDMGELDLNKAEEVACEIERLLETPEFKEAKEVVVEEATEEAGETKWLCPLCGYVHTGEEPPEKCPMCGAPSDVFIKQ